MSGYTPEQLAELKANLARGVAEISKGDERVKFRSLDDPSPLPFKVQVLEPDYLDDTRWGRAENGNWLHEGIEYDAEGRRVAYHLFDQHPGTDNLRGGGTWKMSSTRYPADQVAHIYRVDRPGQMRGVTWFAPVALNLQDIADYQDAQIMRQKIAACFAAFHKTDTDRSAADGTPSEMGGTLSPGLIQQIGMDEDIVFANPPAAAGFNEFMTSVLRSVAAGMGITYERL